MGEKYSEADNRQRMEAQTKWLARAGHSRQVPSLWIYAARDELYGESVTSELFRAYQQAGGSGEFVFIREHALPNGHLIASNLSAWATAADKFMTSLDEKVPMVGSPAH